MSNIQELVHQIHETDRELVKLLSVRVRLTKDFYAIEAQSKQFHKAAEKSIKENMHSVAKAAKVHDKIVTKLYKGIHKHAKSHHHSLRQMIKRAVNRK